MNENYLESIKFHTPAISSPGRASGPQLRELIIAMSVWYLDWAHGTK